MAFLEVVALLLVSAGAVAIPVRKGCTLHKQVENLYSLRSTGACHRPFNGQQLSPAVCEAHSLVSYEAASKGYLNGCFITFTATVRQEEALYGADLALYMIPEPNQRSELESGLSVVLSHSTLGNISSRSLPISSNGWQIFSVDPILQQLASNDPASTSVTFDLKVQREQGRSMPCSEVEKRFLLSPLKQPKEHLSDHTDPTCLLPLLTLYTNASLVTTTSHFTSGVVANDGGKGHVRRNADENSLSDYMVQLVNEITRIKEQKCNATFNQQQVSADLCRSNHISRAKEVNNSCDSDACTITFNITWQDGLEEVIGGQLVIYLSNRSKEANSTDPLLIQILQGDDLVTEKMVPPSHSGWQLFDIKLPQRQPMSRWSTTSFKVRVFRHYGENHLEPVESSDLPSWISLEDFGGWEGGANKTDSRFAPIITVFTNYTPVVCRDPWPWMCLPGGRSGFSGRRSITTSTTTKTSPNADTLKIDNSQTSIGSQTCSLGDHWVPSTRLTAILQVGLSMQSAPLGAIVLPENLNVMHCANPCSSGGPMGDLQNGKGLETCCSPQEYRAAHVVLKEPDARYTITYLEEAVVAKCSKDWSYNQT